MLAQQDGAAVAEHGEVAELVPGVRLGDRPGAGRQVLAGEQGRGGLRRQRAEVEAELAPPAGGSGPTPAAPGTRPAWPGRRVCQGAHVQLFSMRQPAPLSSSTIVVIVATSPGDSRATPL